MINPIIEQELIKLQASERLVECLELRINLCKRDYSLKNEYEKNEADILIIKTQTEIDFISAKIAERKAALQITMETLLSEIEFEETFKE